MSPLCISAPPQADTSSKRKELPTTLRVHRSSRLWGLYADLEESLGTLDTTKAVYERAIELRVATPEMIINYAHLLEEHKYFEESFKVYEKGVAVSFG